MAWTKTIEINGLAFNVGSLGGYGGDEFSLILSKSEIEAAGERIQEIFDWFTGDGQEWCLVTEWRAVDYNLDYMSEDSRWIVYNSKYATDRDREFLFKRQPRAERQPTPTRTPKAGFVYLIKNSEGHYKIGRSVDAAKRIESLGVLLPFTIEPVHIIAAMNMNGLEKELHERFAEKRIAGEWFVLTDEDVEYIKSL